VAVRDLKTLISGKTGVGEGDLKIKNVISGIEYAPNEYIKRGSSVSVDINVRNFQDEPLRFHEVISEERLASMLDDCRFYIVKSSNEDNIQKARDCSVWATTYPNQVLPSPRRTSSGLPSSASSTSSSSSAPTAATNSRDWHAWKANPKRSLISPSGREWATFDSVATSNCDGFVRNHSVSLPSRSGWALRQKTRS
jgi:hypothetical protein